MAGWLQAFIALGAFAVLAPLVAWLAVRGGKRAKGALAPLAALNVDSS